MTTSRAPGKRRFGRPLSVVLVLASILRAPSALAQPQAPQSEAPDALPPLPGPAAGEAARASSPDATPAPPAPPPRDPRTPAAQPPTFVGSAEDLPPCAPRRRVHHGFYFSVGNGFGYVGLRGDGPIGAASLSGVGSTSSLALGGSVAPGIVLAGVVQAGTLMNTTFDGGPSVTVTSTGRGVSGPRPLTGRATASAYAVGAQLDWYPDPSGGWHAGAAVGLGGATVVDDAGDAMTGVGAGLSVFGGYQWWIGSDWSLGLSADIMGGSNVKLTQLDRSDTGYHLTPLSFGLQWILLYY